MVVPTLNEAGHVGDLLADLRGLSVPHEVILADGGSADATRSVAAAGGARVVVAGRGRGTQLRAGASSARAPMLCFLHADVRLDAEALAVLRDIALSQPRWASAFRLRIDASGGSYRLIEWGTHLRTRWFRLPYGDQGLLVRRDIYERAGGYPSIPLMEDVELARALGTHVQVRLLRASLRVSPRRWRRHGPLRRMFGNWILLARHLSGAAPQRLETKYPPERAPGTDEVA